MKNRSLKVTAVLTVATLVSVAVAAPVGYEDKPGIWLGKLNLSPFADLSMVHDSNPSSAREYTIKQVDGNPGDKEKVDESEALNYKAGVNFLLPANGWQIDGRFMYDGETLFSDYADDRNAIYEIVRFMKKTDAGSVFYLSQSFTDVRYDEEFELSQNDRNEFKLIGASDIRLSEKSSIDADVIYTSYDYDDVTCYDYSSIQGLLGFAHVLTEKTDWTLSATYEVEDRDEISDTDVDSDSTTIKTMVGVRTRSTEKLTFNLSAGVEFFNDFEYKKIERNGSETIVKPDTKADFTYNLSMMWKITDRLSLTMTGESDYHSAEDIADNSVLANQLSAVFSYRVGRNWNLNAGASFLREKYTRGIVANTNPDVAVYVSDDDGENRTDDEIATFARIGYSVNKNCSIFADWNHTDVSSSVEDYDYNRERFSAGISLKY